MKLWVDVSLGWIFFCKYKFEELLDSGFEHTELWERNHIRSYSYYVHSIKFRKNNQTSRPPRFDNIKPFMTNLKRVFVDGFPVQYAYPIELINDACLMICLPVWLLCGP